MDQQYLITVLERAGVVFNPDPTIQKGPPHYVRFFHRETDRSLNLGYRLRRAVFVADFVFKAKASLAENRADLDCFRQMFGGSVGGRSTPYARLEPTFEQEAWLIDVIRAYWAIGTPLPPLSSQH